MVQLIRYSKTEFVRLLNEQPTPPEMLRVNGGPIPKAKEYGTWLQANDKDKLQAMYAAWFNAHQAYLTNLTISLRMEREYPWKMWKTALEKAGVMSTWN